jgi:hypothetical protein
MLQQRWHGSAIPQACTCIRPSPSYPGSSLGGNNNRYSPRSNIYCRLASLVYTRARTWDSRPLAYRSTPPGRVHIRSHIPGSSLATHRSQSWPRSYSRLITNGNTLRPRTGHGCLYRRRRRGNRRPLYPPWDWLLRRRGCNSLI